MVTLGSLTHYAHNWHVYFYLNTKILTGMRSVPGEHYRNYK